MTVTDKVRERAYTMWEAEGYLRDKEVEYWLRAEVELTRKCSYCFQRKLHSDFSYEHIWPDALGGDYLPKPWQTRNVCENCNNLSGLFVDGEFIKSWFGSSERASGAKESLDPSKPELSKLPLHYIGQIDHQELLDNETADFWLGPCGSHIVHIRPKLEPLWNTYAGGKPSRRSKDWGSAFLALTTTKHFWVIVIIHSFHHHFRRARRVVLNMAAPQGFSPPFDTINQTDIDQARKLRIARSIGDAALKNEQVQAKFAVKSDLGSRLLAKLALGLGRELLGDEFLETEYAIVLKRALWERSPEERHKLPVFGTSYFSERVPIEAAKFFCWRSAWTLTIKKISGCLTLIVGTPTGKIMTVVISKNSDLLDKVDNRFTEGEVYITLPALRSALNTPITLPALIAHVTNVASVPELSDLEAKRRDPSLLPSCR